MVPRQAKLLILCDRSTRRYHDTSIFGYVRQTTTFNGGMDNRKPATHMNGLLHPKQPAGMPSQSCQESRARELLKIDRPFPCFNTRRFCREQLLIGEAALGTRWRRPIVSGGRDTASGTHNTHKITSYRELCVLT